MSRPEARIDGTGFAGLRRAAQAARDGAAVTYVEPALHAGGRLRTESFLTPFRFNLGPALVPRALTAGARVFEPDPVVAVGRATLGRESIELPAAATAVECAGSSGLPEGTRSALLGLALLEGCDPEAQGSGRALARAAERLPDLVAVHGGNGMLVAALVDEIVAAGGRVIEGHGPDPEQPRRQGRLGTARLFVGLRRGSNAQSRAFATAVGWERGADLIAALDRLRAGEVSEPVGLILSNSHLDPGRPDDPMSSFVWQGVVPAEIELDRAAYTDTVLRTLGIDRGDVHFALVWWPHETGEFLDGGSNGQY